MSDFHHPSSYLWRYVDGIPMQNESKFMAELPVKTEISEMMSKDLKKRGFNFVGSTICYGFSRIVDSDRYAFDLFFFNTLFQ